ncbi:MAG: hypothetical protein ACP59X_07005 [Solidesulfovibrio sp. DCME]|uniref:hypothetical protein n=1 Tax=Solidesulfovibrio sp. DCME TaxID=3447380 RepID=UPI003D148689
MDDAIERIIHAFKHERVSVVLGPMFSSGNGFQPLVEFLWDILSQGDRSKSLGKQLEGWCEQGAFDRLAQGCINVLAKKGGSFFQKMQSEYGRPIVSGPLYTLAQLLPFASLVNMNFDGVLAASCEHKTSLLPLSAEREQALEALRENAPRIVYPLGSVKAEESLILPFTAFRDRKDDQAPYFEALFAETRVLLLGFPTRDFTLDWLHEFSPISEEGKRPWLVGMVPSEEETSS